MNIYLLGNTNIDSIKYYLPQDAKVIGSNIYGNYLIDLIDESSNLYKLDVDLVVFLIDGDELKKTNDLENIFNGVESFLGKKKCLLFLATISINPPYIDTFLNISNKFEFNTNSKILNFCEINPSAFVLDIHKIIKSTGSKKCLDNKFWYLGKIKYTPLFFREVVKEIVSVFHTINKTNKKVLVLDLDNTIWGGIVGEDGDNIQISNEGTGKIYSEIQQNIKYVKDTGVLLAINSKNNYNDAIRGLNHKNSILNKDDFVAIKANWNSKVENMIEIANELNLGLDSFVFLDDSHFEREIVRVSLPEVVVPDFPQDLDLYNNWFVSDVVGKHFSKISIVSEDLNKTEQYRSNIKRSKLKSSSIDIDSFIRSLEININVSTNKVDHAERISQLTQKTNQFNLTTNRFNIKEINDFILSSSCMVYSLEYRDKYNKEGIVGASIVNIDNNVAVIELFLLSCRILGRGVENEFLDVICNNLLSAGVNVIIGKFYQTEKNCIVKNFYKNSGFIKKDIHTYRRVYGNK